MAEAYIVAAVRTAGGKKNGRLSKVHPADMGGRVIDAVVERTGVAPEKIDDVIFGCVSQIGPQTFNVARTSIMSSCLPGLADAYWLRSLTAWWRMDFSMRLRT